MKVTVEELLSEPIASAREREAETFRKLAVPCKNLVVLYGAGTLGRKVASALRKAFIEPVAFADNNAALQGKEVDGVAVMPLPKAAERWRETALFVVTIFHPTGGSGMTARMLELANLGCRWTTTFLSVGWSYAGVLPHYGADLPSRLLEHAGDLERIAALWGDDISRETFRQQLLWRLRGDFSEISSPASEQYFPSDLIVPFPGEAFVDGGAYDGDTLRQIPWPISKAWAFEPDPFNAAKLRISIDKQVQLYPSALGRAAGEARFDAGGTMASSLSTEGGIAVKIVTLDETLGGDAPTFVKLDVEGGELEALEGGRATLRRVRPVVAVCVYHRPEDLWSIPLFLHENLPSHRFFLRIHEHDGFELVVYAIPAKRCVQHAEVRPCPVCKSIAERRVLHRQRFYEGVFGEGYDVVVCAGCGAAFADRIPEQAELDRYYAEQSKYTYNSNGGAESPYDMRRFEAIVDQVEPYLISREARILDIGCATGGLLSVFKRRGYRNVIGADPSPACVEGARLLHGIEARVATLNKLSDWTEHFDLVLLVGVLEHLRDAHSAVEAVTCRLSPNGLFYVAVPDVERLADCRNAPFQQFSMEHLNFFSKQTLTRLLAASGYSPQSTWSWLVEWRENIGEPIVSGLYSKKEPCEPALSADIESAPGLERYLAASRRDEEFIKDAIENLVRIQNPILVWGTGALTRRLLAGTSLSQANIVGFVDSNLNEQNKTLLEKPVFSPEQIRARAETILVCSVAFQEEILQIIRNQLKLTNRVITLLPTTTAKAW